MHVRLWFWGELNPTPRIVAHGSGETLRAGMLACFAPVGDRSWRETEEGGDVYLWRGKAGYCGQVVVPGEDLRSPNTEEPETAPTRPRAARTGRATRARAPRARRPKPALDSLPRPRLLLEEGVPGPAGRPKRRLRLD
jgi:hypothetical protein